MKRIKEFLYIHTYIDLTLFTGTSSLLRQTKNVPFKKLPWISSHFSDKKHFLHRAVESSLPHRLFMAHAIRDRHALGTRLDSGETTGGNCAQQNKICNFIGCREISENDI